MRLGPVGPAVETPRRPLDEGRVQRWIHVGRLAVVAAVYGAALLLADGGWSWGRLVDPATLLEPTPYDLAAFALVIGVAMTPVLYWHARRLAWKPGSRLLALQAFLDVLVVTGVVHLTGGSQSVLAPILYIALVSGYALLLPLGLTLVIALVTGLAYLTDLWLAYPTLIDMGVLIQVAIFTVVALVSGTIGGRLRQVDAKLTDLEAELRRLRLGTSDILRSIGSGVLTLDDRGHAAYMNPAAEALLGVGADRWLGEDLLTELDERAPGVATAVRDSLGMGGPVADRDIEIIRGPDEHRPAAVSTDLLERPGGQPLVTVVMRDMRMARRLEELHLRAGRLEAVAELSASLAHEIKNPLASIRSAVEQLSETVEAGAADEPDAGADRDVLGRLIVREADRLSRLLGEFNDFARVDVIRREPLDLDGIIDDVVTLVRQRPDARDAAAIEVSVRDSLEDLWGDPDLVHRILFNLVLNAVQVGTRHGTVRVRIVADALRPHELPRQMAAGNPVRIRIIDDGPGIDREDRPRIFDPFYTRREGGSGMGLAIAHRGIQAHGGALMVHSTPGGGATFVIVLPRRDWRERKELEEAGWTERPERSPQEAGVP